MLQAINSPRRPSYMVSKLTPLVFLVAVSFCHPQLARSDDAKLPNIVLIMADDLGWMDLHCQGNKRIETPHIDGLAEQGIRFTNGYASAPVCTPTRASIMTGKSPARLAITNHAPGNGAKFHLPGSNLVSAEWTTYLDLEHVTIAERLKGAGYATGFVGKWHLSHRRGKNKAGEKWEPLLRPQWQGFDLNVGGCSYGGPPSYFEPYRIPNIEPHKEGDYLPDRLADECIDFVKQHRARPFFLTWWNYSVHYPFQAPKPLIEKYQSRVGRNLNNPTYAAMIEGMDRAIGKLLNALDDMNLTNDTLLIFTSDNGAFGADSRPLRGAKGYLYEGGIRVPWIVRWPGVAQRSAINGTPIISTDIFPTLLDVAGLKADPAQPVDGESLIPLLDNQGSLKRTSLYFHYPNYAFHKKNRLGSAIREGDYKLIHRYDDDSLELYNLADDIGEKQNLARKRPDLARRLDRQLSAWLDETGAKKPTRILTDSSRR